MENVVFPDECEVFFQVNVRNIFELKILFFNVINKKFFFRQKIGSFKHAQKKIVKNVFLGGKNKKFIIWLEKNFCGEILLVGCVRSLQFRLLSQFNQFSSDEHQPK